MVEDIGFLLVEGTHRYCSATNARKSELAYALDALNFVTPVKICRGGKKIANMAVEGHLRPIETRMVHSLEEK